MSSKARVSRNTYSEGGFYWRSFTDQGSEITEEEKNVERFTILRVILASGAMLIVCIVPILVYVLPKQIHMKKQD